MDIQRGYRSGALARCIEMHATYYSREVGFGRAFEAVVASGLGEFAARMDSEMNAFFMAVHDERIVGTVAIDGEDIGDGCGHLRWFITGDEARGTGIGRRLLAEALTFCDRRNFRETHLWTFKGLDAARHLYEANGFSLVEERRGRQWGEDVLEQRFVRRRASCS